jgi:hypothetical protein
VVESQLLARSSTLAAIYEVSRSVQWTEARFCRIEGVENLYSHALASMRLGCRPVKLDLPFTRDRLPNLPSKATRNECCAWRRYQAFSMIRASF